MKHNWIHLNTNYSLLMLLKGLTVSKSEMLLHKITSKDILLQIQLIEVQQTRKHYCDAVFRWSKSINTSSANLIFRT